MHIHTHACVYLLAEVLLVGRVEAADGLVHLHVILLFGYIIIITICFIYFFIIIIIIICVINCYHTCIISYYNILVSLSVNCVILIVIHVIVYPGVIYVKVYPVIEYPMYVFPLVMLSSY